MLALPLFSYNKITEISVDGNTIYEGYTQIGHSANISSSIWAIKRTVQSVTAGVTTVDERWSSNSPAFADQWSNRATLTYN